VTQNFGWPAQVVGGLVTLNVIGSRRFYSRFTECLVLRVQVSTAVAAAFSLDSWPICLTLRGSVDQETEDRRSDSIRL
jgi:hypothetical protein